jgi:hypothetical protein
MVLPSFSKRWITLAEAFSPPPRGEAADGGFASASVANGC